MENASKPRILIVYTGGTIGMIENPATGALENFDFESFRRYMPELQQAGCDFDVLAFNPPIDSSDMEPRHWVSIARTICEHYEQFDGFVVLHGTDTMAYTASALSFMLENLSKPVIVTGSQLPIGKLRTDGKENLLTSLEIAAARDEAGRPRVPEVCIYFDSRLMRGNRTTKVSTDGFDAFSSYNYPSLARAGVDIHYRSDLIRRPVAGLQLTPHYALDTRIVIVTLFPGLRADYMRRLLDVEGLRAVILQTYGAGNAPQLPWLVEMLRELGQRGVLVVNLSQCKHGGVVMDRYETGLQLLQAGVSGGYDSTIECTVTKLMVLFGDGYDARQVRQRMCCSLAGEISVAGEN